MVKVLGLSGSPRKSGNTDILLDNFLRGVEEEGVDTETIYLRDYVIQPCIGCEQCRKDKTCTRLYDGMQLLYPKFEESKGLVMGSPSHNYNVTSWIKAFIDRLYPYYDFTVDRPRNYSSRLKGQDRKAIVFGICEQPDMDGMGYTLDAMSKPLETLGYEIETKFPLTSYFDRGAVSKDEKILLSAYQEGRKLAKKLV